MTKDYIVKCLDDENFKIDKSTRYEFLYINEIPKDAKENYIGKIFHLRIKYKSLGIITFTKNFTFITTNSKLNTTGIYYNSNGESSETKVFNLRNEIGLAGTLSEQSLKGNLQNLNGWECVSESTTEVYGCQVYPNSIYDNNQLNKPFFEILEPYVKGNYYRGITSNFESESSLYDYKTHYYLGEYLRYIRDLDGINLMPYYNC